MMTQSNLVDILQRQTERKVAALHHDLINQRPAALRQCIQAMRDSCHYLVLDVVDQAALATIAAAVDDFPILTRARPFSRCHRKRSPMKQHARRR